MVRKFGAAFLAMSLMSSTLAYAAPANQGALAPGKPVGVKEAQTAHSLAVWLFGLGIIAGGIIMITAGKNNNNVTVTTTTTAP